MVKKNCKDSDKIIYINIEKWSIINSVQCFMMAFGLSKV